MNYAIPGVDALLDNVIRLWWYTHTNPITQVNFYDMHLAARRDTAQIAGRAFGPRQLWGALPRLFAFSPGLVAPRPLPVRIAPIVRVADPITPIAPVGAYHPPGRGPVRGPRHGIAPVRVDVVYPGIGPGIAVPVSNPVPREPTGPRQREQKWPVGRAGRMAARGLAALAAYSEFNDFVDVLYDALPRNFQRSGPHRSVFQRYQLVWRNLRHIRVDHALIGGILNELQDAAIGRAIGRARRGALAADPNGAVWRGVQSQRGFGVRAYSTGDGNG